MSHSEIIIPHEVFAEYDPHFVDARRTLGKQSTYDAGNLADLDDDGIHLARRYFAICLSKLNNEIRAALAPRLIHSSRQVPGKLMSIRKRLNTLASLCKLFEESALVEKLAKAGRSGVRIVEGMWQDTDRRPRAGRIRWNHMGHVWWSRQLQQP